MEIFLVSIKLLRRKLFIFSERKNFSHHVLSIFIYNVFKIWNVL